MKLTAIFILYKINEEKVKILQNEFNLDHIGRLHRGHIKSCLIFAAKAAVQQMDLDRKESFDSDENFDGMIHVYVRSDGLAAVVTSDDEYPKCVAHNLLSKVMGDFTEIHPDTSWTSMPKRSGKLTSLNKTLMKYQKPDEADPFLILQNDVDETKRILADTLEKVEQRQIDVDDLAKRAENLSAQSEEMFEKIKKHNRRHLCSPNSCFPNLLHSIVPLFSFDKKY